MAERGEAVSNLHQKQANTTEGRQAAAHLDDFRLRVLGPEGLRWGGAADSNEAGRFAIQSRSDQLAAGYRSRNTHTDYQPVGTNGL